ncbi:hypothetical protein [Aquabacterium humicola]|uniref:hypothetical protein n=1 Tax=Aquabacterium humicola TaxID=3237377 RepID=UPI002543189B|nr:hypothetical protein [Rubrivivax pictus]
MNVHLTFDIEVWCNGWDDLDGRFPASFERYCYGSSQHGRYALPKTLEIMNRHGITGVFFVEPLFSARFGPQYLDTITKLIADAGQDIQLHLHPEWTDELPSPPIADATRKRQHLTFYTQDEQAALIGLGRRLLEASTGRPVTAFRAGSFAANRDTYAALRRQGILVDSSLNAMADFTGGSIDALQAPGEQRTIDGVTVYPITVFRDGFGRARPAQVGASSIDELTQAMLAARAAGCRHFVIVSHNFEMLKPGGSDPDWIVVRRFERLCAYLGQHRDLFQVGPLPLPQQVRPVSPIAQRVTVSPWSTAVRHVEQLRRRLG